MGERQYVCPTCEGDGRCICQRCDPDHPRYKGSTDSCGAHDFIGCGGKGKLTADEYHALRQRIKRERATPDREAAAFREALAVIATTSMGRDHMRKVARAALAATTPEGDDG